MRFLLISLFNLFAFSSSFCQSISSEISDSIKKFWKNPDTLLYPTCQKFTWENKQVVFFGTRHDLKDISDPMFAGMERELENLHPTLILSEGSNVADFNSKAETIKLFGDAGVCAYAGYEKGIKVKTWDIPYNDLYYSLRKKFPENELYTLFVIFELNRSHSNSIGFSSLISDLEAKGWPIKPEQKKVQFFLKQYKHYFDIPLEIKPDNSFAIPDVAQTLCMLKCYSLVQQLRDEHLLKVLQESLRINDRIFIQAGAAHLSSLKKIIPLILSNSKKDIESVETDSNNLFHPDSNSNLFKAFSVETILDGQNKIILFGSHNSSNGKDQQFTAFRKEIRTAKPDLLLTQGFAPVFASKKQTISEGGIVGFGRLLGISKDTRVNSCEPPWGEVYYALNSKYKQADIFFSLLCWGVLNEHITGVNATERIAEKIVESFLFFGYPLDASPDKEFDFFNLISEHLGQSAFGKFGTPRPSVHNPEGAQIKLKDDGSYFFSGTKPGIYKYEIPIDISTSTDKPYLIPLELNAPAASFVEISGSLLPPANYMSIENLKGILKKCINTNIIDDLQTIRTAHLLKQIKIYKQQYKRILIQVHQSTIHSLKEEINRSINK
jgi:hypothetical protein